MKLKILKIILNDPPNYPTQIDITKSNFVRKHDQKIDCKLSYQTIGIFFFIVSFEFPI